MQNFHLGYREAGPAFFWTWPVVFSASLPGPLLRRPRPRVPVLRRHLRLGRRAGTPLRRLAHRLGLPGLARRDPRGRRAGLADHAAGRSGPGSSVLGSTQATPTTPPSSASILIALSTFLNVLGTRWLAAIMTVGVVIELLAAVC